MSSTFTKAVCHPRSQEHVELVFCNNFRDTTSPRVRVNVSPGCAKDVISAISHAVFDREDQMVIDSILKHPGLRKEVLERILAIKEKRRKEYDRTGHVGPMGAEFAW